MVKLLGPTRRTAELAITNTVQDLNDSASAQVVAVAEIRGLELYNPNGFDVYLQVFDVTSGSVTLGTTDAKQRFMLKALEVSAVPANYKPRKLDRCSFAVTRQPTTNTSPVESVTGKILYGTNFVTALGT